MFEKLEGFWLEGCWFLVAGFWFLVSGFWLYTIPEG